MTFPSDLRYTKEHEWLRLEEDGKTAVVGVTDFAQRELGDIVFVELEAVGAEFERDEVFGTVEAVKTVSELFAPVGGRIVAHNEALEANPELINEDPYGRGWMVRIELTDPDELSSLLTSDAYADHVA